MSTHYYFRRLANVSGTIPVNYKEKTYNIPICLWLKIDNPNLKLLNQNDDIKLIYKLLDFENIVYKLKDNLEPQTLSNYLHDLAALFHKYYAHNRIITENMELSKARLVLIKATKIVIKNGLTILGISAPESM